jgi:hypothetical protein
MSLTANVPEMDQNCNDKRLRIAVVKILKNNTAIEQSVYFHCLWHFRILIMIKSIIPAQLSSPCYN